jgi:hypothetical protein
MFAPYVARLDGCMRCAIILSCLTDFNFFVSDLDALACKKCAFELRRVYCFCRHYQKEEGELEVEVEA